MKDPLGVSPSNGNQGTTRGKEKILLTLVGMEPTTSGLDLPLLPWVSHSTLIYTSELILCSIIYQTLVNLALVSNRSQDYPLTPP